jgi:protein SCO1/2
MLAALALCAAGAARGEVAAPSGVPLPLALGGAFTLTDQTGRPRSEADPQGRMQLVYFGYANCQSICTLALPQMAEIADRLAGQGVALVPVLITVDPARDTVATIGPALARLGPGWVGLTGAPADLARVRDLFGVRSEVLFEDPFSGPVHAHGSYLYLMDGAGRLLTILPPILTAERAAAIIAAHAGGA